MRICPSIFFGTKVGWICQEGQIQFVKNLIQSSKPSYVTYTNVHVVVTSKKDEKFRTAINEADLVSPDGMPLVLLGKRSGANCIKKCSGPDMMIKIIEAGLEKGYKHYFYGSSDRTLNLLEEKLREKYPEIKIVGKLSPPYRPLTEQEDKDIVHRINELKPDCIWIGLGAPKQELWMYEHKSKLTQGVMFGVGAAFDFHAGLLKRAPQWMQNSGLEWLYRLICEPKRLFKRYVITNSLFLWYILKHEITTTREHECYLEEGCRTGQERPMRTS